MNSPESQRSDDQLQAPAPKETEREAILRAILGTAVDGIIAIDEVGIIQSANPAAERTFGYTADEMIGSNVALLMPEPYRSEHDRYLVRYQKTGERHIIGSGREVEGLRKDGSQFPLYLGVSEVQRGERRLFTGIVRDISDLKRFEGELRQSRQLFEGTLNAIAAHLAILDESGTIVAVNKAWRDFGAENGLKWPNAGVGANYLDVCNEAAGDEALTAAAAGQGILDVMKGRRANFYQEYPCHSPNQQRWFAMKVTHFDGEHACRAVVLHEDITGRRRAQDSAVGLGRVLEDSLNEIYIFDAQTLKFIIVNRGARNNLGYSMEELRGKTPPDIKPDYTVESFERLLEPLRAGHESKAVFTTLHQRKDGSLYDVEVHLQLGTYAGVTAFVAIILDITERRKAEAALHQAQRKALQTERLAAIGQMAAGLAHESRNALQRSQACLEMLAAEVEDQPESMDLVQRIQRAQDDLHRLYEEVREYASPINIERTTCDIAKVWRDAWSQLEVLRSGRNVELAEPADADTLRCHGDAFALAQVFRNVFENALAACPDPGHISIQCREVTADENRSALEISVKDDGAGISIGDHEKIFDPFFTTKTKGTGLGMAIAWRVIQAHEGKIAVGDSDGGAEILITLPKRARE